MPSFTDNRRTGLDWRVEHFAALPSTSDLVRTRARAGAAEGLVVVAERQTAGRGRHGRSWTSPEGNLYLTLLLRPGSAAKDAGALALVAGLALAEACIDLGASRHLLRLKWPNDLVLGSAKVGGVLLEAETDHLQRVGWVSVGIGVNVAQAPAVPGRESAALVEVVPDATPAALLERLLERLSYHYQDWRRSGLKSIRDAWCDHQLAPGTPIVVRPGNQSIAGTYVGIDVEGALLLEAAQLQRITTGEVLFAGEALALAGLGA